MESVLRISNLSKKYDRTEAIKGISLEVGAGEVFGFLGPNGAGKTTTMKCCAGLLRPTTGHITVNGHDIVKQAAQAKAHIGFLPDSPYLYEKLTGREYALFLAGLYGVTGAVAEKRADDYFELFDLTDWRDELIQGYSRGMRQKTGIIAALLHQPDLLLVDEPTASLDPKSSRLVKDIFGTMKKQGRTVFMSTHVMEIAESLCDRIGIIHQGELKALGTIDELRAPRHGETLEDIFLEVTGSHRPEVMENIEALSAKAETEA